jgi:hypothetical protein
MRHMWWSETGVCLLCGRCDVANLAPSVTLQKEIIGYLSSYSHLYCGFFETRRHKKYSLWPRRMLLNILLVNLSRVNKCAKFGRPPIKEAKVKPDNIVCSKQRCCHCDVMIQRHSSIFLILVVSHSLLLEYPVPVELLVDKNRRPCFVNLFQLCCLLKTVCFSSFEIVRRITRPSLVWYIDIIKSTVVQTRFLSEWACFHVHV